MAGFAKWVIFILPKNSIHSIGVRPAASMAPTIEPALVPDIISGCSPASNRACATPKCANPLAPPPPKAKPSEYNLLLFIVLFFFFLDVNRHIQAIFVPQNDKLSSIKNTKNKSFV